MFDSKDYKGFSSEDLQSDDALFVPAASGNGMKPPPGVRLAAASPEEDNNEKSNVISIKLDKPITAPFVEEIDLPKAA